MPSAARASEVHFSRYHFTGKERDTESGNDYFVARYYASSMGRFMSPDPSQLYYADPTNPQSSNLYAYVVNNPLINIDPSGTECVWDNGSYDAADDPDTGEGDNGSGKSANDKCAGQGGTWIPPSWFEGMEGTQYGDWSGQASSQIQSDMLTPSATVDGDLNSISADPYAHSQRSGFESLFCLGDALHKNGLSLALDAVGLLPEGGAVAGALSLWHGAAGVSNGIKNLQAVKVGAGIIGTASAGSGKNRYGTVVSTASIGASLAQAGKLGAPLAKAAKAVPLVGTVLSLGALGGDAYLTYQDQSACVDSGKYD